MLLSGTGRHRRIRLNKAKAIVATTSVAGAAVALPLIGASGASAATVSTWDKVAQCESGGDWTINTGNGYYGGLQFSASTWRAYGGGAYASVANQASKAAQISVAERVLASQGPGAWPVCGPRAGLSQGSSAPAVDTSSGTSSRRATGTRHHTSAPRVTASTPSRSQVRPSVPVQHVGAANYTVKPGDTLSKIAAAQRLLGGWQKLYQENRSVVGGDPNLIYPGQRLVVHQ
jgi:LysM repeat protein